LAKQPTRGIRPAPRGKSRRADGAQNEKPNWLQSWAPLCFAPNLALTAMSETRATLQPWIDLLKADKLAFFTACSQASKAADYLRGLALADRI
jgi:antirestriction protein ArdC